MDNGEDGIWNEKLAEELLAWHNFLETPQGIQYEKDVAARAETIYLGRVERESYASLSPHDGTKYCFRKYTGVVESSKGFICRRGKLSRLYPFLDESLTGEEYLGETEFRLRNLSHTFKIPGVFAGSFRDVITVSYFVGEERMLRYLGKETRSHINQRINSIEVPVIFLSMEDVSQETISALKIEGGNFSISPFSEEVDPFDAGIYRSSRVIGADEEQFFTLEYLRGECQQKAREEISFEDYGFVRPSSE
ncbi:MAG: hypothetical protein ABIF88_02660 [archaeon]